MNKQYNKADSKGEYIDRLREKWPFRIKAHGGYEAVLCGAQPLNGEEPLPIYRFPGGRCVVDLSGHGIEILEW